MEKLILFVSLGLGTGAIYVALGLGLVISYRTAAVVNFGQAAMFLIGAAQYQDVRATGDLRLPVLGLPVFRLADHDPGFWVAMAIAIVVTAIIGMLSHVVVFRRLRNATPLVRVVASIGIMLTLQAVYILRYGAAVRRAPSSLPAGSWVIFGARVPIAQLALAGIVIVLTGALGLLYGHTRFGRETAAVADGGIVTTILGVPRERVATISWAISGAVAGLMGALFASIVGVDAATYPLMVVPALGASLLALFRSFGRVLIGGFAIGVAQSLITYGESQPWVPAWARSGVRDGLPFLVIIFILWRTGESVAQRGTVVVSRLPRVPEMPRKLGGAPVLLIGGIVSILLAGSVVRLAIVQAIILAILAMSLVLLTGFVGQVSLAQGMFAGMGGFTCAILADRANLPLPLAQLLAVAGAAVLGLLVALPALRIRGIQLAIVTLAAGVAIEQFVFRNPSFTGGADGVTAPALKYGPIDLSAGTGRGFPTARFSIFVLANLVLLYVAVRILRQSKLGKLFLSIRANERGASAAGIDPRRVKLLAFTLSAAIAGWSGVLTAHLRGQLSFESFGVFVSIGALSAAYIGGISRPAGAIIAGLISAAGPINHYLDDWIGFGRYIDLVSALGLVFMAVQHPDGLASALADGKDAVVGKFRRRRERSESAAGSAVIVATPRIAAGPAAVVVETEQVG